MELLDERWTLLVVRELAAGSRHFNDLRRGLPRMSPTLLSKRLRQLTAAGVVDRRTDGTLVTYLLTDAGQELVLIVFALGQWDIRRVGELGDRDLDPKLLLWDMRRHIDHGTVPGGRTVLEFRFPDVAPKQWTWWLVAADDADLCDEDPGHPVTVLVEGRLRALVDVWLGRRIWKDVLSTGDVELHGPPSLCRAVPSWFTLSEFAPAGRG